MDMRILEQKDNPLLKRKEVRFKVGFTGPTPSRKEIKESLGSKLGVDSSLLVIDVLKQGYGSQEISGYAKVYEEKEAMRIENKYKLERDSGVKKEKPAEAKAPAKEEKGEKSG
ncbi:MAG: SSU ribosomal protein S24e [Candidatus Fermentimicrarchaeum limneticum]|uniref:Small ribosomal subunit protein eS24 n=1 Tax=Fermentimicrarchaeum limneticum TaxID=2795018 RepID=A0A7D6BSI2_FERL1|nr:MAG: SSU ribosomal protein S24e [Candidatus Fermentimicrarchaeum limneticum]